MLGLMVAPFWSAPIETVLAELMARPDGLARMEANRRRRRFGPNRSSGFVPLPPSFVLLLLGITGGYLGPSELVKGWIFRRFA